MANAFCWKCVEDKYLRAIVKKDGKQINCSVCKKNINRAITVEQLGKLMEPIMREHFEPGATIKTFGPNDSESWEQEGEPMQWAVQLVIGQYFDFEDEIVDAVCDAEDIHPQDGDVPIWDTTSNYVETPVRIGQYHAEWRNTLDELKHNRRFFSPSARALFRQIFDDVDKLKAWAGKKYRPVVRKLPTGTTLFRARICNSREMFSHICKAPFEHVGPPPKGTGRAGRMNADGVVVFYGAQEEDTCLAEMRPALGNELALIAVRTTRPMRVLDFVRLEQARYEETLSYFQPDFNTLVEKRTFLRTLHRLISQPIIPGREADYLITQTMAEYLAHVHNKPFDGILFSSAQRKKGTNIVLFSNLHAPTVSEAFGLSYVDASIRLFSTKAIRYKHHKFDVMLDKDGNSLVLDGGSEEINPEC